MQSLNALDFSLIAVYFLILVSIGLFLRKSASATIEDYFIGGRKMPWWAMGITGMASFLDMAGTMVITSLLFLLGPRGLFIEFRGGAVLILAVMMLWTGKWHRRSKCLTMAEWMTFRFGDGTSGRFAQFVWVLAGVLGTIGFLAYLIIGAGLFLSLFLPFSPLYCSLILVSIACFYTILSGFYGVVATDLFQSLLILVTVIVIACMAFLKIEDAGGSQALADLSFSITRNSAWMTSSLPWETHMPESYQNFRWLLPLAVCYLLRNVFGGMGSGADPKYFGAKNDRECAKLTLLWTATMTFRWPLMIGFAVLGLFLVQAFFPDPEVLRQAASAIASAFPDSSGQQWNELLSRIANNPQFAPPELASQLHSILGDDWRQKILLVNPKGDPNPEMILPAVILHTVPMGLRGLLVIGLVSAALSTFSSAVNTATGLLTRDIYQKYFRPDATQRELIRMSWFFALGVVAASFAIYSSFSNINDIWSWLMMSLGGGMLAPQVLRLYWGRFNGQGFATGIVTGMLAAILQRGFFPDLNDIATFVVTGSAGMAGAIIGTYLSRPTPDNILKKFYLATRPFGFWSHMRSLLSTEERHNLAREHKRDIVALPFALLWQVTLFLIPMQAVIHQWPAFWVTLATNLASAGALYFLWFRHQPRENFFPDTIQPQTSDIPAPQLSSPPGTRADANDSGLEQPHPESRSSAARNSLQ